MVYTQPTLFLLAIQRKKLYISLHTLTKSFSLQNYTTLRQIDVRCVFHDNVLRTSNLIVNSCTITPLFNFQNYVQDSRTTKPNFMATSIPRIPFYLFLILKCTGPQVQYCCSAPSHYVLVQNMYVHATNQYK